MLYDSRIMMSGTHIAVGIASACVIAQTGSPESCAAAIIGGALGSAISDTDIKSSKRYREARRARIIVAVILAVALFVDWKYEAGICYEITENLGVPLVAGVLAFAGISFFGAHTEHRTFMHSLLGGAALSAALWLICPVLVPYFAVAFASHVLLDLLNHTPVRVLYPLKHGFSLGICKADGAVNTTLLVLGIAASALLLAYRLAPLFVVE